MHQTPPAHKPKISPVQISIFDYNLLILHKMGKLHESMSTMTIVTFQA